MASEQSEQATDSRRGLLRRKWRLLVLVVLCLVLVEVVAARLWDELHYPKTRQSERWSPSAAEAWKQPAVDLVRASGIVERINGGQLWGVTEVRNDVRSRRVSVYVEWDKHVESDGPWLVSSGAKWLGRGCSNVRSRFNRPISNIRFLRLLVDMDSMEIVRIWPSSFPPRPDEIDDQPVVGKINWLGIMATYNERTARIVYKGPLMLSVFVPGV